MTPEVLAVRLHETAMVLSELEGRMRPYLVRPGCLGNVDGADPTSPMATLYQVQVAGMFAREALAWLTDAIRVRDEMAADEMAAEDDPEVQK